MLDNPVIIIIIIMMRRGEISSSEEEEGVVCHKVAPLVFITQFNQSISIIIINVNHYQ